jgi:glycosyltransferase involved in cell wall biosynthesis
MNDKINISKNDTPLSKLKRENSESLLLLEALLKESQRIYNQSISMQSSICWKITAPIRFADKIIFQKKNKDTSQYKKLSHDSYTNKTIEQVSSFLSARNIIYNPEVVCFDVSVLVNSDAGTGIQRVVREIARNIVDQNNPNFKLVDFSGRLPIDVTNKFLPHDSRTDSVACTNEIGHIVFLDSSWNLFNNGLNYYVRARDMGVKITTVIYDIFPLTNPEFCAIETVKAYKRWFSNVTLITDGFLSISKSTSESLEKHINGNYNNSATKYKYDFWHLGSDIKTHKEHENITNEDEFILMVSTVEPRKNYEFVVDQITNMWKSKTLNHRLVIVGRPGWNYGHVHKKIKSHPEIGKKLIWHDNGISDELLNSLYNKCSALIQASFNEGFGLAVVEASSFSKPIVLSDIPVFRETVIKNGYFFELGSGSSFERALHAALSPNAYATTTIQKSWSESTNDFLRLFKPDNALEGVV